MGLGNSDIGKTDPFSPIIHVAQAISGKLSVHKSKNHSSQLDTLSTTTLVEENNAVMNEQSTHDIATHSFELQNIDEVATEGRPEDRYLVLQEDHPDNFIALGEGKENSSYISVYKRTASHSDVKQAKSDKDAIKMAKRQQYSNEHGNSFDKIELKERPNSAPSVEHVTASVDRLVKRQKSVRTSTSVTFKQAHIHQFEMIFPQLLLAGETLHSSSAATMSISTPKDLLLWGKLYQTENHLCFCGSTPQGKHYAEAIIKFSEMEHLRSIGLNLFIRPFNAKQITFVLFKADSLAKIIKAWRTLRGEESDEHNGGNGKGEGMEEDGAVSCECAKHLSHVILDLDVGLPAEELYHMLYGEKYDTFHKQFLIERDYHDIVLSDWAPRTEACTSDLQWIKQRTCTYDFPLGKAVGPARTIIMETQSILKKDDERGVYVVFSSSQAPKMTLGDAYSSCSQYCITRVNANKSHLHITFDVEFHKSVWPIQGTIFNLAISGFKDNIKALTMKIKSVDPGAHDTDEQQEEMEDLASTSGSNSPIKRFIKALLEITWHDLKAVFGGLGSGLSYLGNRPVEVIVAVALFAVQALLYMRILALEEALLLLATS